jgi:hypothetical protein
MIKGEKTLDKDTFELFQKFVYGLNGYDGTGSHIMHFETIVVRYRDTGVLKSVSFRSLPADLELTEDSINPTVFKPYQVAKEGSTCVYTASGGGLVPLSPPTLKDPTKCKVKSKITAKDLVSACYDNRLAGDFAVNYLRIKPVVTKTAKALPIS